MDFFGSKFEIYPFYKEKYGHAQCSLGGGMEHTTVSFMGNFSRSLIAHELAHQWFGDKITCGTWKDIWLNEGFATYLASLVIENFDGEVAFVADKTSMISTITATPGGAVYLTDTEATNIYRIFSSQLSYDKGAMVLNMLRFKLGDALFFQGLKNYLSDPNLAYKYAVTSDLQSHLEAVYGNSLSEFFNDWIYNQGYPTYSIKVENVASGQARLTVNQTTSHASVSFFEMPLPIRLLGAGGLTHDVVVNNTVNGEQFTVAVPFAVTGVQFDPKKELIAKVSSATLDASGFALDAAISLSPNPASSALQLDLPSFVRLKKMTIYNQLGQKVLESALATTTVTSLAAGVHFVEIETSEGVFHKKFIKI
jgi:aminopeptidase N